MSVPKSVLFVGHSHIQCIADAIANSLPEGDVQAVNLNRLSSNKRIEHSVMLGLLRNAIHDAEPAFLCLCLAGNVHNVLGLIETPEPFSIGEAIQGVVPPGEERHFIPHALMKHCFANSARTALMNAIYEAFPKAARYYLNPPPPVSDWEHIKLHPGTFREKLDLGPAPDSLRLHLYRIQTEVFREMTERVGAKFVEPDPSLIDEHGFLAKKYYNADPTHGNLAYGKVMLRTVLEQMRSRT